MACVQLTEDVIEIVVETIDREIHRLTKARAGLLELRQRYDHEPPERDAAPIAVSDQEATPAMKTARKPRVVKKASSGKSKARFIAGGRPRSRASTPKSFLAVKDILQVLDIIGEPATAFAIHKTLEDEINVIVDESAVKAMLKTGAGRYFEERDGRWSLVDK